MLLESCASSSPLPRTTQFPLCADVKSCGIKARARHVAATVNALLRWQAHHTSCHMRSPLVPLPMLLLLCSCLAAECSPGKDGWLRPGCHKVGNTRKISIPDCVEFTITTNACRGFCESYAVPSVPWTGASLTGLFKPPKPVVSVGQCCNMMKSEEIQRRVLCIEGMRNVTFKSAVSCSCYHCKKD